MKIGIFDFEMSNLSADFGILLCGVVKIIDVKEKKDTEFVYRMDKTSAWSKDPSDDSELARQLRDCLRGCDVIVSYNGRRFDIPFLNTRLMGSHQRVLPKLKHIDLLYQARYGLHLHNATLKTVQTFFATPTEKTEMRPGMWVKAVQGQKGAMDYVVDHCQRDVRALEELFYILEELIQNIHT